MRTEPPPHGCVTSFKNDPRSILLTEGTFFGGRFLTVLGDAEGVGDLSGVEHVECSTSSL